MAGEDPANFVRLGKECTQPNYVARVASQNAEKMAREDEDFAELMKEVEDACAAAAADGDKGTGVTTEAPGVGPIDATVGARTVSGLEATAPTAAEIEVDATKISAADPVMASPLLSESLKYVFPSVRCTGSELHALVTEMRTLADKYKSENDYAAVRDQFCACSLALNELGMLAPRFRPQPLVTPKEGRKPQCAILHRDHLIIDAHWLWCAKTVSVFKGKYDRLLDPSLPFDFALAGAYAQENWASHHRAEEQFMLPDEIQWQLLTTKSKEHVETHRKLFDGVRVDTTKIPAKVKAIQKLMAGWAKQSPKIRGEEQHYADLWAAREMLGRKATAKSIAELAGLMSGHPPLEASTARKKLSRLDQRLLPA